MTPWGHPHKGTTEEYLRFPYGDSPQFEQLKDELEISRDVLYYAISQDSTQDTWHCDVPENGLKMINFNGQCGFAEKPALQSIQNVFTTGQGKINIPILVAACVVGALVLLGILYLFSSGRK